MRFQSPLKNLSDVLIQIQESAASNSSILIRNEAATRAVLVDPILRALGWDTANTSMVEVEKTYGQVRADYALFDNNAIPKIIVEAKALGTNFDQNKLKMALVNYAFNFKLSDVFLTDGIIWMHFDKFQPGQVEPSKTINLVSDDPVDCAAYFVQHLDAAKYWRVEQNIDVLSQRLEELESTVITLQKNLDTLIANQNIIPDADTAKKIEQLQESAIEKLIFVNLENLDDIAGKSPLHLRLPDGSVQKINTWKDILKESCKFVLGNNLSIPVPYPDRVGRKIFLFNIVRPQKGVSYITHEYQGKTIYIYVNYDSYNCVENALHILKLLPQSLVKVAPAIVLE